MSIRQLGGGGQYNTDWCEVAPLHGASNGTVQFEGEKCETHSWHCEAIMRTADDALKV